MTCDTCYQSHDPVLDAINKAYAEQDAAASARRAAEADAEPEVAAKEDSVRHSRFKIDIKPRDDRRRPWSWTVWEWNEERNGYTLAPDLSKDIASAKGHEKTFWEAQLHSRIAIAYLQAKKAQEDYFVSQAISYDID